MGMGSNITSMLRNLNAVYSLTYTPGYVSGNGDISTPSATNKEVVSDFIENPFKTNERYLTVIEYVGNTVGASTGGWLGIGLYDANQTFRTRIGTSATMTIQIGDNGYTVFALMPVPYDDGLCRISFRSFGEANIYILPAIRLLTEAFNPNNISGHTLA